MNTLKRCFPFGKMKAVTLSYDDGKIQDERLIEMINKYHLKGTFHLNANRYIDGFDGVEELYTGHEISLHTYTHPHLEQISKCEMLSQLHKDKEVLEQLAKYPVTGMSYPYGSYDESVVDLLYSAGIEYCRTVKSTENYIIPDQLLTWHPTCHDRTLKDHSTKFVNMKPNFMSLLYIWGHSYEFEDQNRWDYIEEQFEIIANKDDIWYATNIEIARYLIAMRKVVVSCMADMVYNPSAISIWIECNGKIFEIKPGELTKISF